MAVAAALTGADADELDRAATALRVAADELDAMNVWIGVAIRSTAWTGGAADQFADRWGGAHRPRMAASAASIREAAMHLAVQSADQRAASRTGRVVRRVPSTSPPVPGTGGGGEIGADLEQLSGVLDSLGVGRDLLDVLRHHPGLVGEHGMLQGLIDILGAPGLAEVLAGAEHLFDVGTAIVDLATDFVEHPDLPFDERLVHAFADMATRVIVGEGGEQAAGAVVAMMMAGIVPGAGALLLPLVKRAAEHVVGQVIDEALSMIDGAIDVVDVVADQAAAAWRFAKDQFGLIADPLQAAFDVVADAGDLIAASAGSVVDLGGEIGDAVGDLVGGINPLD